MKKLIVISFFLLSCATDYYGNAVNLGKEGVALIEIERDLDEPDIFWIKTLESDSPLTSVMETKKNLKRYMRKIMNDYGYSGYGIVDRAYIGLALNYYMYEVRFFTTREDYDNWDKNQYSQSPSYQKSNTSLQRELLKQLVNDLDENSSNFNTVLRTCQYDGLELKNTFERKPSEPGDGINPAFKWKCLSGHEYWIVE